MKKLLLTLVLVTVTIILFAQSDYDIIDRNDYYIIKTGSSTKSDTKTVSDIMNLNDVEQLLGKSSKTIREYRETQDDYQETIEYNDGIILRIPESKHGSIKFHITSSNYTLLLKSGEQIKVGMNSNELSMIFPNSFAKRQIIQNINGYNGKTGMLVYFSFKRENKVFIEDAWISFIIGEDGILKEIKTVQPS